MSVCQYIRVVFMFEGTTCKAVKGSATCKKDVCCLGTDPAWKGVNLTAKVYYYDKVCRYGTSELSGKSEKCVKVCGTQCSK